MYTYIRVRAAPPAPRAFVSVRSSAMPRLGYKVGILRVPVVSCRPLGDRTELRKVGACTGTFLSATYVVGGTRLFELSRRLWDATHTYGCHG